ncbi:hypothetical protein DPMN_016359 [Dreissena polymorpha]|uniref:Uncharacterized protein n=1 Tax=Dreissena polymorpha TaxID=45954 RepID=A0A9D4S4I9_DREPO|nr:hypothetical protein DPMN_016359 [Dreissena polymorpha]
MLTPRFMKLHRYIDHDWQMTPIDFQVTRYIDHDWQMTHIDFQVTGSKVKVTVIKNVITQWLSIELAANMGGMHILQNHTLRLNSFTLVKKGESKTRDSRSFIHPSTVVCKTACLTPASISDLSVVPQSPNEGSINKTAEDS